MKISLKLFIILFLVFLIPTVLLSYVFYSDVGDILSKQSLDNEKQRVELQKVAIENSLLDAENEVIFLSKLSSLYDLINIKNSDDYNIVRDRVVSDFMAFSQERGIYYQIRYINESGMEVVRIDYDGNTFLSIDGDKLQNKSGRYYFEDTMNIDKNEVFISPLDLNIERGEIENRGTLNQPEYVPVIRYGIPVFDDFGNKMGIIITNIYANSFLEDLKYSDSDIETLLVNRDGYYLVHSNKEKEWGFMFDREDNFGNDYYQVDISNLDSDTYQTYDTNQQQHLTFTRVYPGSIEGRSDVDYFWIITGVANQGVITSEIMLTVYKIIFLVILIALIVLVISYLLGRTVVKPIYDLIDGAKIIEEGDIDYKVAKPGKDEISQLSRSFDKMTLAIKKSRADINKKVKQQTGKIIEREEDLEKQQIAILNILEDVEDEKLKTEQIANDLKKFELAVNDASDHIVITDIDGIVLHANRAVEKITGFKLNEVIGKKAGDKNLWGGEMDLKFYKELWKTIKTDKKTFSGEIENKKKDGKKYTAFASITPVLDKNDKVLYFVGIERDITKEKEIDRMKTEFVSVASHQLRTPLTAIRWFIEELHSGELGKVNKEQKDYLKQAMESNERMIGLVNDLLNVSRLEMGRLSIDPEPTDMVKLVEGVVGENRIIAQARNCEILFTGSKTKLNKINIDQSVIGEVVNNLISNAIKYSKPVSSGCSISVRLEQKKPNIGFSVKDSGVGIPSENQHRIFEKFFRADNVVRMETEGTGLGLYISRMVIEASGGKIWFESSDKGTTFSFSLPLAGSKAQKGERKLA